MLKTLSAKLNERSFELYRPPKPYMEVRYAVNDSYMTVLGNPQDPVYVPTVREVSGNSTTSAGPNHPSNRSSERPPKNSNMAAKMRAKASGLNFFDLPSRPAEKNLAV